ncbi:MAG: hypothetical protein QM741_11310 [Rudaea sp.]|uniref:hypothetical protein n=1 Tax=Rudaea sp. TaxID=2136325 RepID=UPI0039E59A92
MAVSVSDCKDREAAKGERGKACGLSFPRKREFGFCWFSSTKDYREKVRREFERANFEVASLHDTSDFAIIVRREATRP